MKVFVVLALVAAVAMARHIHKHRPRKPATDIWGNEVAMPTNERLIEHKKFESGKMFEFFYDAQILTGVPQSSKQHAGTRMQCLCRLQFKSDNEVLLQLKHIQVAELNRKVPSPRAMVPMEACDEVPISEELKIQLELPVKFNYQSGLISELQFDSQDLAWSTNIKKGVLNLLQVRMENRRDIVSRKEEMLELELNEPLPTNPTFDFFTVKEETMEGKCNTTYTVTQQPCRCTQQPCYCEQQVLNVTKSINFEECESRPEIKYNFRFGEQCPNCGEKKYDDQEKFLESSTVYQYNITGERNGFVIDSARAESQYIFAPYNEQSNLIVSYTNQTLVLIKSGSSSRQIPQPSSPKTKKIDQSLVYSPMWDVRKEKFFMDGEEEFLEKSPYSEIKNKVKLAKSVLEKLVKRMNNGEHSHMHKEAPRQLARLVKVLRLLKKQEITKVFEKVMGMSGQLKDMARDMLVDSMGLCGTKGCLSCLLEQTKEEKINPIKAALSIKSFVQSRVVSKEMIDELRHFCKTPICQENGMLRQSCLLTTGSMIGALCQPNEDYLASEFLLDFQQERKRQSLCPKDLRSTYAQKLTEMLNKAENTYERVLILKTISNAGLPECVVPLEKIIRNVGPNKPYKTIVRSQAIEALRQLTRVAPKSIQRMLMPIYMNQREIPELRMAALHQVMQTLPERPVLDQITRNLVSEPSKHVAGFTVTYLKSLANSTNPCEKRMADDLKLSLRHAKIVPETLLPYLSRYYHLDTYSRKYHAGVGLDLGVLKSNMSYLPHDAAVSLHGTVWGFWRKYLLTLGVAQQDLDQIIWNIMGIDGSLMEYPIINLLQNSRTSGTTEPAKLLKKIFEKLAIQERRYNREGESLDPMAMLYMRFFDQEYGVLPMSVDTMPESIKSLFTTGRLNIKMIREMLETGSNFNYHTGAFIRELSRKIPTPVGMPIVFNMKVPTILSVKNGEIKANIKSKTDFKVTLKAQPSMASTVVIKMEVWNPIVNTGVKAIAQVQAHLPIDMNVNVKTGGLVKVTSTWNLPNSPYKKTLVQLRSKPITFTFVWPKQITTWIEPSEKTIVGEEWNRVKTFNYRVGEQGLGTTIQVRGQVHRTPRNSLPGTPWCLLSGPNRIQVVVTNGEEAPKKVVFELTGNLFQELKKKLIPKKLKQFYKKGQEEFFETDSFETSSSEEIEPIGDESEEVEFKEYVKNYESSNPTKHQIKMVLKAVGPKPRQISCSADVVCGEQRKHCNAKMIVQRTPIPGVETENVKFVLEGDCLYPETPYTMEDLTEDKKAIVNVRASYGPVSQMKRLVDIKIQGERSLEQQNLLENSRFHTYYRQKKMRTDFRSVFSPISQYDQLIKASTLTQYKIYAKYNKKELEQDCPTCMNATMKAYRMLKYMAYWNSDVNQMIKNPANQIRAIVKLDPKSYQLVNITAEMPYERIRLTDLPLPKPIYPMNLRSRRSSVWSTHFSDLVMARCMVGSNRVDTFDQVSYRAPLTTCYSVLAKDCSSSNQPRFAIMMKKVSEESEMKKVKIVTESETVTLKPKCDDCKNPIEIKVNNNVKSIPQDGCEEFEDCTICRVGPYVKVKLQSSGVKCYFDGYATTVKVSPIYRGVQCGLCGHYDGEESYEFLTADKSSSHSRSKFFRSFLHKDGECKLSATMEQRLEQEEEYRTQSFDWEEEEYSNEVDEDMPWIDTSSESTEEGTANGPQSASDELIDDNPYSDDEEESSPTMATRVVETSNHICFSTKRVPICPTDTFPKTTKQSSQKIHYRCVEKSEPSVDRLHRQALRMEEIDLEELSEIVDPEATVEPRKENVPVSCTEF